MIDMQQLSDGISADHSYNRNNNLHRNHGWVMPASVLLDDDHTDDDDSIIDTTDDPYIRSKNNGGCDARDSEFTLEPSHFFTQSQSEDEVGGVLG